MERKADRGGGVGGSPPPRSDGANATPTVPHKATPDAQKIPRMALFAPLDPRKPCVHREIGPICGMSDKCPFPAIGRAHLRSAMRRAAPDAFPSAALAWAMG